MADIDNSSRGDNTQWATSSPRGRKSKPIPEAMETHAYYPQDFSSRPTSATYVPNFTTIVHDEGRYEHVPIRDLHSSSVSSKPEYLYSNRTSITSSGSTFSQLDSPAELIGHNRLGEMGHATITRPEPVAMRRHMSDDMQIAPAGSNLAHGPNGAHVAFRESTQIPNEKRGSRLDSVYTKERNAGNQRDSQSSCSVYIHQGYSEKQDSSWRTSYPDCVEEPMPKLWKVMMYLTVANPFVCGACAFYTIISVVMAAIISPFRRRPSSPERLASLSSASDISDRSKFGAFMISQLLPLHEFHFRLLTARPMQIVDSCCASPTRLALVHLASPCVALLICFSSVCVFFAWIYGLILSDSGDVSDMEEWVVMKWEAYLMKAFVAR